MQKSMELAAYRKAVAQPTDRAEQTRRHEAATMAKLQAGLRVKSNGWTRRKSARPSKRRAASTYRANKVALRTAQNVCGADAKLGADDLVFHKAEVFSGTVGRLIAWPSTVETYRGDATAVLRNRGGVSYRDAETKKIRAILYPAPVKKPRAPRAKKEKTT